MNREPNKYQITRLKFCEASDEKILNFIFHDPRGLCAAGIIHSLTRKME
jgi:hypothetical protein